MSLLPIESVLPELLKQLAGNPAVVLQAPPGAGKTTRVPLALLDAPWLEGKSILMLEPRRLAATNAARWMARSLGQEAGETIGYTIRFERRVSSMTRIEIMTEGILTRRIQSDSLLEGVGLVIFDEFHERNLQSDLALALCRDVQLGLREELKILVMSATLDAAPVSKLLGNAPLVTSAGKAYPVTIHYTDDKQPKGIADSTAAGIARAFGETEGDILAFLPGEAEIRSCQRLLKERLGKAAAPPLIFPLYAGLTFAEQERAILPAGSRKIVLATNIAETSLTIEGVRVVVDSGWSRQLRYDPASGLDRLVTLRISKASADQRAGRAGRTAPGVCYRLWSQHVQQGLVPFTRPEILSADLLPLALELSQWGVRDPGSLAWLDAPPAASLEEANRLLVQLSAIDNGGHITEFGRQIARLPAHPRLSHMMVAAAADGDAALATDLAALLTERDIFRRSLRNERTDSVSNDIGDRLDLLELWRQGGNSALADNSVDLQACAGVDRISRHWLRILKAGDGKSGPDHRKIGKLLALAYPDRIALERDPGSGRYLLANGRGAALEKDTRLYGQHCIVPVDIGGGDGEGCIRLGAPLAIDELRRLFAQEISRVRSVRFVAAEGRVMAREQEEFGALILSSRPIDATAEEIYRALLDGILPPQGEGIRALSWSREAKQLQARALFLARFCGDPSWPDLSDSHLAETLQDWLSPYLGKIRTIAELAKVDLVAPLKALFSWEQLRRLDEGAPTHLVVPSGSRIAIEYGMDEAPVLAVKLQELFGLAETPLVAWGKVPVLLHLLSPAQRPIQVTRDLRNFWNSIYPEVKKELKGRYPKHPWPDDPWNAVPTRHTKKRADS